DRRPALREGRRPVAAGPPRRPVRPVRPLTAAPTGGRAPDRPSPGVHLLLGPAAAGRRLARHGVPSPSPPRGGRGPSVAGLGPAPRRGCHRSKARPGSVTAFCPGFVTLLPARPPPPAGPPARPA